MIIIEPGVKDLLIEDGLKTFPDECCGFLYGSESGDNRIVTEMSVVDNSKKGDKTRRFEISPLDYMKAEQRALDVDLLLLGVYHSHPKHLAVPSEHDRVAAQPWFSYIIISILSHDDISLRSWRLNEAAQFEEEKIEDYQFT